ncbi:MAG: orotidine-5'-phosphate decarboxylase [Minisyncoccales bacterium]
MNVEKMKAKDRIIVALDVPRLDMAIELVKQLQADVGMFKVGLELLHSEGTPKVVRAVQEAAGRQIGGVFVDVKLHDIPNTVAGASRAISKLGGVEMFNLHASGGIEMIRAAVQWKGKSKVLAVTVLTSLAEDVAHQIYGAPIRAKVLQLAKDAKLAGVDGIICSPQELQVLGNQQELSDLLRITPGVRPKWAVKGDQKRVTTPADAIKAGADYLVVGRPITKPPKEIGTPVEAAIKIAEEIEQTEVE